MQLTPPPSAKLGDRLDAVNTPALLIDLDAFDFNLRQMAELAARYRVSLRPHAKAHKSSTIAQAQIAAGAVGICCQKLSEAYPFVTAGVASIHISNEFVGAAKIAMAVELAKHVQLSVCVDHPAQVHPLGFAAKQAGVHIKVLPEVDVGQERCGVTDADDLLALVEAISHHQALHFGGLQAYHGGAQHVAEWQQRRQAAQLAADTTAWYLQFLEARGIRCEVVTGGGSGTAEFDVASGIYTEIQPGSYVFMDRQYSANEWKGELKLQRGLYIAATIMSTSRPGRVVCDVGLKTVAVDSGLPAVKGTVQDELLQYVAANDEHGILEIQSGVERDRLGERLLLVPGHCDPTANLYDQYVCFRGDTVEALWDIDARGLSR